MANYANLIALVNDAIKTNGIQAITGQLLQTVLDEMIGSLGTGYQFAGLASPGSVAPSTDAKIYLFASEAGGYNNFHDSYGNPIELAEGELAILANGTYWTKYVIATLPASSLTISTDVPDLSYNESEPQTIADQMGQSIADVLATGAVRFVGDVAVSYYKVIGYYGAEGGYITFIGVDKVYQYDVNASGYITDEKVTSLAPDDELSETSENAIQNKVVKAAFDAKQGKDANAIEGNVAVMDGNGNSKGSNVPLNKVAKIDGQYDTLISGYAGNLIDKSDAGSEQQIMFRKTGGTTEVSASTRAMFKRLLGRSLVWNQMRLDTVVSQTSNGITIGYDNATGCLTFTGTATNTTFAAFTSALDHLLTVGHKYYMHFKFVEGYISGLIFGSVNNPLRSSNSEYSGISVVNNTGAGIGYQSIPAGTEINAKVWLNLIDLTVMYGAGYEPATVAEVESVYNKPYYPHNAGTFINNVAQTYEAIGLNQWDEEWQKGYWNGNVGDAISFVSTNNQICSKNPIPVVYGQTYYGKCPMPGIAPGTAGYFNVRFTDANGVIVGLKSGLNTTFVAPAGAVYMYFGVSTVYGSVYNHDICINLSNPDINGTYAPYVKATATLGLSAFRVKDGQGNITTVNGLKSAGDVYDEVDLIEKKYIKRIGVVDLGTLNYTYNSTLNVFANQFFEDSPTARRGLICQKYAAVKVGLSSMPDKSIALNNYYTGSIYNALTIKDSAYTDKNVFKAAMNGVLLYYELAEPVVFDLVDEMPEYSQVWGVGTENILPEGVDESGVPLTTPLRAVIYYPKDYTGIINNLPKNYISKESLTNMLNALKSAGVITSFTMTWNAETQTYNFTIS